MRKEKKVEMIVIWWKAFGGGGKDGEGDAGVFSFKGSSFERKPSNFKAVRSTSWREILSCDVHTEDRQIKNRVVRSYGTYESCEPCAGSNDDLVI